MVRRIFHVFCFSMLILAGNLVRAQAEFSAEIVDLKKPDAATKIYSAKDKIRIEPQASGPHGASVILINLANETNTILVPERHMYTEVPAQALSQRGIFAFFRSGDVENACADWEKMQRTQSGNCHKVGHETINGRASVEYEGTNSNGKVTRVWIDAKLRLPLKWQGGSDGELRNIREDAQPASLFEIPAGYTKLDLGPLMQQPR